MFKIAILEIEDQSREMTSRAAAVMMTYRDTPMRVGLETLRAELSGQQRLERLQAKILAGIEEIAESMMKQAADGNFAAARFLFETAGVKAVQLSEQTDGEVDESLCEALLRRYSEIVPPPV